MAQKNGIESRVDSKGRKRYRGIVYSKGTGEVRGPWGPFAQAKTWRSRALREIETGRLVKGDGTTLRAYGQTYIDGMKDGSQRDRTGKVYKPSTVRGYQRGWARIDRELGPHKLTAIRRQDIDRLIRRWLNDGLEPGTIRNTLDPLRAICRQAIRDEIITVNPTADLEVPRSTTEPMRFATREEAAGLIAALPSEQRALWATAMYAGLRRGELRALRWSDVELEDTSNLIHVTRSWDDSGIEIAPKTKGSNRRVAIVPPLARLLVEHQTETGRSGSDLVFGRSPSVPFMPSTVRARALKAWKDADPPLDPITLHQCRHTCASLMIAAGANPKSLSVALGHAAIEITFNRYGHLMPGGEVAVGEKLASYLDVPSPT